MRVSLYGKDEDLCKDNAILLVMGSVFTQAGSKEEANFNRFTSAMMSFTAQPLVVIDFQDKEFNAAEFSTEIAKQKDSFRSLDIFLPIHGSEMTFIGNITILNPLVSIPLISDILGDAVINVPFTVSSEDFMQSLGNGLKSAINQSPVNIWHFGCQAAKLNPMANQYFPLGTAYYTEGRSFLTHDIFLDTIIKIFYKNELFTMSSFLDDYYRTVLVDRNDHYSKLNNPTLQIVGGAEKDAISSAQALFEAINSKQEDSIKLQQAMDRFESTTGVSLDNMIEFARGLELKPVPVVEFYATQWVLAAHFWPIAKIISISDFTLSVMTDNKNVLWLTQAPALYLNELKLKAVSFFPTQIVEPNFGFCIDEINQRSYGHWKYYDPVLSFEDRAKLQENACLVSAFSSMENAAGEVPADKILPAFGLLADYYYD